MRQRVGSSRPGSWLTLTWVLVLGLLATLPLGAVLGSLFPSQRSTGPWWLLMLSGLAAISGVFCPIMHLPAVLQRTGQAFPLTGWGSEAFGAAAEHDGGGESRPVVAPPGWAAVALPACYGPGGGVKMS